MTLRFMPLAFLALLAGCAGNPDQVLVTAPPSTLRISPLVGSLEVRDVSLPRYAADDAVAVLNADGTLSEMGDTVWADTPDRALTLQLAGALEAITGARVAAEPWPFGQSPAASLTVRIEQSLARPGIDYRMTGQYAIAPVDSGLSDRSGRFSISVPLPSETAPAVAAAQGQAITELAETIARRLAR